MISGTVYCNIIIIEIQFQVQNTLVFHLFSVQSLKLTYR